MCSAVQECSLPNVTFGQGTEADSGFLQQVSYDERDWVFGSSTVTDDTGPSEDNTEGDTDGLFAYLNGLCTVEPQTSCESERVSIQPVHCSRKCIASCKLGVSYIATRPA